MVPIARLSPTPGRRPFLAVALAFAAFLVLAGSVATPGVARAGYASIVVDAGTGKVLHARNADTRNYPASLTKMMTLYMLFEAIDRGKYSMSSRLKVSSRAAGQPPSKLGVKAGGTIAVRDAIRSLVTKSANDVAVVVAENLAGSETAFARKMTAKARALGMSRTTFRNASGLPNSGQMSTARDMALLSMALLKHFPHHYHFFSTQSFRYGTRTVTSHNHLLNKFKGADGLKTGYIRASGFNVATSAVRDGRRLIGVVFGGRTAHSRDAHMVDLLTQGFAKASKLGDPAPPPDPKPALIANLTEGGQRSARVLDMGSADDAPPPPPHKPHLAGGDDGPAQAVAQGVADVWSATLGVAPAVAATPKPDPAASQQVAMGGAARAPLPPPPMKSPEGSWGIQVGAFRSSSAATDAMSRALARLEPRAHHTLIGKVVPHSASSGTLYRARILGMTSEDTARGACDTLVDDRRACLIVLPSGSSMVFR